MSVFSMKQMDLWKKSICRSILSVPCGPQRLTHPENSRPPLPALADAHYKEQHCPQGRIGKGGRHHVLPRNQARGSSASGNSQG